jgi:hypothetical protein
MIMQYFTLQSRFTAGTITVLLCLSCCLFMPAAAGADIDTEGIMGEPITFHGFSYVGDSVYLFLTGPGLPVNGVTLTDITRRADQGHFTVVDVDDNQEWIYSWKTSRIDSAIDDGTYIIYVTNEPKDLSQLGDDSRYKTISVYLKDSGVSKVSIRAQHAYPRTTEDTVTTPGPALPGTLNSATPTVTVPPPIKTVLITTDQTMVPTARAGTIPSGAVTAILCCAFLVSFLKVRP